MGNQIQLPDDLRSMLDDPKYLHQDYVEALLELEPELSITGETEKGLESTILAQELGKRLSLVLEVKILKARGGWFRKQGRYKKAEECLDEAAGILEQAQNHYASEYADVIRRMALLRLAQGRVSDAQRLARQAVEISRSFGGLVHGDALFALGQVLWYQRAYVESVAAIRRSLGYFGADRIRMAAAFHALIIVLAGPKNREDLGRLCTHLKELRRCFKRSSLSRSKCIWAEAVVNLKMGNNRRAYNMLIGIAEVMEGGGAPEECALFSIDLAQAYLNMNMDRQCCAMLRQAASIMRNGGMDHNAVQAVASGIARVQHGRDVPWSVHVAVGGPSLEDDETPSVRSCGAACRESRPRPRVRDRGR